jgi:hypothetical protein
VQGRAVVCEIGQHDANVDGAGEEACAEASDGRRRNLSDVDGAVVSMLVSLCVDSASTDETGCEDSPDNRCLTNTETSNEAAGVDGS